MIKVIAISQLFLRDSYTTIKLRTTKHQTFQFVKKIIDLIIIRSLRKILSMTKKFLFEIKLKYIFEFNFQKLSRGKYIIMNNEYFINSQIQSKRKLPLVRMNKSN